MTSQLRKRTKAASFRNQLRGSSSSGVGRLGVEPLEDRRMLVIGAFAIAPLVNPSEGFDGVVALDFGSSSNPTVLDARCTGSLLTTGMHILTAARCVTDRNGVQNRNQVQVVFEMFDQQHVFDIDLTQAGVLTISPTWNGESADGADWAVIELPAIAPFPAERYDLFTGTNERNDLITIVGYGETGTGTIGQIDGGIAAKRIGFNEIGDIDSLANGDVLQYDFDDGTAGNNTLGDSRGLGVTEASTGSGDSGGPWFIDGRLIAAVTSFGGSEFGDTDNGTRISDFAPDIRTVLNAASEIVLDMNFQPAGGDGVDDQITARRDPNDGTRLQLLINGQEVWSDLLTRVTSLTIVGSGDNDTVVVNGDLGIRVDVAGHDPQVSDTLVVNGTTNADTISYTPSGATSGSVTVNAQPPINFTTVEHVIINGEGGGDTLTVNTVSINGTQVLTPGTAFDRGTVDFQTNSLGGGFIAPSLQFLRLGNGGRLAMVDGAPDATPNDNFIYHGTGLNDTFTVTPVDAITGTVVLNNQIPVSLSEVSRLTLAGLDGDDRFTVNPGASFTGGVVIEGGTPSGSDIATLNGTSGADTITLTLEIAGDAVTGVVGGPITLIGTEVLNLNSLAGADAVRVNSVGALSDLQSVVINTGGQANDTLRIDGTSSDDTIVYTPTGAGTGEFFEKNAPTRFGFNVNSSSVFTIEGSGAVGDTVEVVGTNNHDFISVDSPNRTVTVTNAAGNVLKSAVLHSTIEEVTVLAGFGNDTVLVIPAPATVTGPGGAAVGVNVPINLLINVDGGPPGASDALVIASDLNGTPLPDTDFAVINRSRTPDEGVVRVFRNAVAMPDITYTNVEIISPIVATVNPATGNPNLLILGPDQFEQNEFRATASFLGAGNTINLTNLAIFPNANEHRFVAPDQDWYRVVAQKTGTLDFQVYFRKFSNSLLPAGGNLDLEVRDESGTLISGFGANDNTVDERVRIPAVAGQTYYVRVFGGGNANGSFDPANQVVNGYSMTIVNQTPPVPFDLELDDVIGSSEVGNNPTKSSFKAPINNDNVAPFAGLNSADNYYQGKLVNFVEGPAKGERAVIDTYKVTGNTATFTLLTNLAAAPNPGDDFIVESIDTGRSQLDNTTRDNTPVIFLRLDDGIFLNDLPGNDSPDSPPDEVIPIPFSPNANTAGYRLAIFDEGNTPPQTATAPQTPIGYARQVPGQQGVYVFDFAEDTAPLYALSDGSHFLSARVQIIDPANPTQRGFGGRSVSLEVVVDTGAPPLFFGLPAVPNDGLDPSSDTGVAGQPATFSDGITSDTSPTFFGTAEANSIVRLYVDRNDNNKVDNNDLLIAQTVAVPLDGTNQLPGGRWVVTSNVDLNDPNFGLPKDGLRTIMAAAEDLAGNITPANAPAILQIFLDTSGPKVRRVTVTGSDYELFDPKPSEDGPTPLITQIDIHFLDKPERAKGFVYPAVNEKVGETIGNYALIGDHTGRVLIVEARLIDESEAGDPGQSIVRLTFGAPLADDRFTLTLLDNLVDHAGNRLDGESQASSPFEGDTQTTLVFPSGDGQPGGNFVARFTVDTRPEIGTFAAGSIFIDINGNLVWDFEGQDNDATNRDLVFTLGVVGANRDEGFQIHDGLFAGNFANGKSGTADGFDKLAAFGFINGGFRWIIDTNNDGVVDVSMGDFFVEQPNVGGFNLSALPFAGDFDRNHPGDEIGLFDGTKFLIDTNGNNLLESSDLLIHSPLRGAPIAGDFDGDGLEDLATWRVDRFSFDLRAGGFGNLDATIDFGFPGVAEQPVAADMDHDGIDDVGLFVPRRSGTTPEQAAEWYFLLSNDFAGTARQIRTVDTLNHPFSPIPLGQDLFAQLGDEFALPIVGNFDPPVSGRSGELAATTIDVGLVHAAQERAGVTIEGDRWIAFHTVRDGSPMIDLQGADSVQVQLYDADLQPVGSGIGASAARSLASSPVTMPPAQYFVHVVGASSSATITISNQLSPIDRYDVNRDGMVAPNDLLQLIDSLNRQGIRSIDFGTDFANALFLDTTLDGQITPHDSLVLIDYLNRQSLQSSPSFAGEAASGFLRSVESSDDRQAEVAILVVPSVNSTASTPATKASSESFARASSSTTTSKVSGSATPALGGYSNRVSARGHIGTVVDAALADEDDWSLVE